MKPSRIKFLSWLVTSVVLLTGYNLAVHFAGLHPSFWRGFWAGVVAGVIGIVVGDLVTWRVYSRRMRKVIDRQADSDA